MDIYELGIVQCIQDVINYFKFRREMTHEFYVRDSKFNKLGLHLNWLKNIVYTQINCTDEDLMNANYDQETMVLRKIRPMVEYLGTELNWSDYLIPQISNFVDEDGEPSLSFGILFVYTPYRLTWTKAIIGLISTIGIIGVGIWASLKFLA